MVAAVQAGRAGARTLLVEKNGILGGTMTAAGVCSIQSFHAFDRQVIAGIGWELAVAALKEAGGRLPGPGRDEARSGVTGVTVVPAIFAALADEAVQGAGVDLLLHTMLGGAAVADERWLLTLCTKTGLRGVEGKVVIDCTGDANAVTIAGLPVRRSDVLQPGTLIMRLGGYDFDALDRVAIQAAFERAVADGTMLRSDAGYRDGEFSFVLGHHGGNTMHVTGIDGATSESRTAAELEARRAMMRIYRFCRRQPGLQDLRIEQVCPEVGIRESVRITGRETLTKEDYVSGRVWEDSVCYAQYFLDLHNDCGTQLGRKERCGVPRGTHPTVPLGALISAGHGRMMAAGRCVSSDRQANGALRVEASCMAMGQAAGAAAALAARPGVEPACVPMADLRELLEDHDAIVPGGKEDGGRPWPP